MEQDILGRAATGFAVFDAERKLTEANRALLGLGKPELKALVGESPEAILDAVVRGFRQFGGAPAKRSRAFVRGAIARWSESVEFPIEAETRDGAWKLLSAHPRPGGGTAFISLDITPLKQAQARVQETEEIFRCIVESHPLPVWMADEETGEILYESLAASEILGRAWGPETPRYITDHYADVADRERVKRALDENDVLRDYEVRFKNAHGECFWISANVRRGSYGGRRVLIAGILDITARKEREDQIRFILEGHPLPMWMNDAETGELLFESPATAKMFGREWSRDPNLTIHAHYVDMRDREVLLERLRRDGVVEGYESLWRRHDGSEFWARGNVRLMEYQGREVVLAGILDVTEQKSRELELSEARKLLSDAIESLSEGFALYDENHELIMCNSRYREMNELAADILTPGMKWSDLVRRAGESGHYSQAEGRIDEWLAEQADAVLSHAKHHEVVHEDGRWFEVSSSPTRQGGFVITRSDVTERKLIERGQRQAGDLVRQVLEACPVMIMMNHFDDGRVIYRNPASIALFGEPESVLSFYADPSDREVYLERMRRDGYVDSFEYDARRPDGSVFRASVSGRLIDYQGDKVIVSHTVDLTDRNAMVEELDRQREILHQSEKMSALGGLLAGVAHELNNPLSIVVGQSLLLKEITEDADTAARAEKIGKAADRCARIVKTFLAMARQQPSETANISVNETVETALEVAGYAIRSSNVAVTLQLAGGLPPVWGDADQLAQVFTNLLLNAENALSERSGDRRISVSSERETESGQIVVRVEDNGPGIPEEYVSRIFEPFFTTKEVGAGTGIGLAFCHRIVETHGGELTVESPHGGTTVFCVRLPVTEHAAELVSAEEETESGAGGERILVIDDEADVAELIADILTGAGHAVTVARTGAEGLRHLDGRGFSLILSDLNMPELSGSDLFGRLVERYPEAARRLAFITGDTMSPKARAFLEESGRPYLEKPIRPDELRSLVGRLVESLPPL